MTITVFPFFKARWFLVTFLSQAQLKSLFLEPYFPVSPGAAARSLPSVCTHAACSSPLVLLLPPHTCCIPQGACRAALGLWQQMVQAAFKSCNCTESTIPQIEMLLIYLFRCSSGWLLFVSEGICLCAAVWLFPAIGMQALTASMSHAWIVKESLRYLILFGLFQFFLACKRGCPCAPILICFVCQCPVLPLLCFRECNV